AAPEALPTPDAPAAEQQSGGPAPDAQAPDVQPSSPLPGAQWSNDPVDNETTTISSPQNPVPQNPMPHNPVSPSPYPQNPYPVAPVPGAQYDPAGNYDRTMVGQPTFGMPEQPGAQQSVPQQAYSQQPYGVPASGTTPSGTAPFGSQQPYGQPADSQGFPSQPYQQPSTGGQAPYGTYGPPGSGTQPFQGQPDSPAKPAKSKKGLKVGLIALGAIVLLALIGGGVFWFLNRGESDDEAIKRVSSEFAKAVATQDTAAMTKVMCKTEADRISPDDTAAPTSGGGDNSAAEPEKFDVKKTEVSGDNAKAELTFPSDGRTTALYFTKEDGNWVVCDSAAENFTPGS
ncbi:MAG: hypothetical protein WAV90_10440, partial [Gordonia amarae]